MAANKSAQPTPPKRPSKGRKIAWIVATATSVALIVTFVTVAMSGNNGSKVGPRPTPSDGFFAERVGVTAAEAGCSSVERPPYQGHKLIAPGAKHPAYNTNPPASGWFIGANPEAAYYEIPLPIERIMNVPSFGGIIIWSSKDQAHLARRYTRLKASSVLIGQTDPSIKSGVVFMAWGVLQRCQKFSGAVAENFGTQFYLKALKAKEPKAVTYKQAKY